MRLWLLPVYLSFVINASSSTHSIYENLPVGEYAVGFKIFTLTDETRIEKPEYNYLGEKNEGDRRMKMTVHLWYPAKTNTGNKKLSYEDYCYNHLLKTTSETIDNNQKQSQINGR